MNISDISWPGWEVVRLIGKGSFGAVYEIRREHFGEEELAALKVISIPQSNSDIEELLNDGYDIGSITTRYEGYLKDIVGEYSLMAKMKGHSNVVYCDDLKYEKHDDGIGWDIYIKMELLEALPKALGEKISEEQVIKLGKDICNALCLCKRHHIVHRDIKPQNIFVSEDGTFKLGDFGIAKTAERTTSGTKVGTYKYMAPEVYKSEPYGAAADIYSLGLVLYWMLNERRTPFLPLPPQVPTAQEEDNARHRRFMGTQLPPPAHGSKELQKIVLKACAYDSKERYHSADELLAALNTLPAASSDTIAATSEQLFTDDSKTVGVLPTHSTSNNAPDEQTVGIFHHFNKHIKTPSAKAPHFHTPGLWIIPIAVILILAICLVYLHGSSQNLDPGSFFSSPVQEDIEYIEVIHLPVKTIYQKGDPVQTQGLSIRVHYHDETTQIVSSGLTVTPSTLQTSGLHAVTVSYQGAEALFYVTVNK